MVVDGLVEAAEDDAFLRQGLAEGGADGHAVEDGIHRHGILGLHARQNLALAHRDAQFVEGLLKRGIYLFRAVLVALGGGVVDYVLEVDFRQTAEVPPRGRSHGFPLPEGLQAEFQQPLGLILLGRDHFNDVLVQAFGDELLFYICNKTLAVFLLHGRCEDVLIF